MQDANMLIQVTQH